MIKQQYTHWKALFILGSFILQPVYAKLMALYGTMIEWIELESALMKVNWLQWLAQI